VQVFLVRGRVGLPRGPLAASELVELVDKAERARPDEAEQHARYHARWLQLEDEIGAMA
jgi:hypothetical protein